MSADSMDGFPYKPYARTPSAEERRQYWAVAIGLQEVDGLHVSSYLRDLAKGYESAQYSLDETRTLLAAHYASRASNADPGIREADLVSQRIAELLESGAFALAPEMLSHIHRFIFQDLDADTYLPGIYKSERLVKQEEILNGDSVLYADPSMIELSLAYLFREENTRGRGSDLSGDALTSFCRFIALLWQVHPFVEGNTRTIAVFSELYLRALGFNVTNDPFAAHARYYRDALVRANYRNPAADISPDTRFIQRFYDNMANNAGHELKREDLLCPALFDNPTLLKNIDPAEALHSR